MLRKNAGAFSSACTRIWSPGRWFSKEAGRKYANQADGRISVCLVGGSAGSHILAGSLDRNHFKVSLLTRRPESFSSEVTCRHSNGQILNGALDTVTSDEEEVIPNADIILVNLPVSVAAEAMSSIAPYVSPTKCAVGFLYGQGGINFWAQQLLPTGTVCFALKYFPWVARIPAGGYGNLVDCSTGRVFGGQLGIACTDAAAAGAIASLVPHIVGVPDEECGIVSWTDILLSANNQLVHPARLHSLHKQAAAKAGSEKGMARKEMEMAGTRPPAVVFEQSPLMYGEWDGAAERQLLRMQSDLNALRAAVQRLHAHRGEEGMQDGRLFPAAAASSAFGMRGGRDVVRFSDTCLKTSLEVGYGRHLMSDSSSITSIYNTLEPLKGIRVPTVPSPCGAGEVADTDHRFFSDDVAWGLVVLRSLGDILNVATPAIDDTLTWAQGMVGKQYLVDGRLDGADVGESGALSNFNVTTPSAVIASDSTFLSPAPPLPKHSHYAACAAYAAYADVAGTAESA